MEQAMKRFKTGIVALVAAIVFLSGTAFAFAAISPYKSGSKGIDLSYPNCSATITKNAAFGVVGVTGGLPYTTNNCAAKEARQFKNYTLYANTGLNASKSSSYYTAAEQGCNGCPTCAAYHYGYNAGLQAFQYAKSLGLSSATWWLSVSTANTWNRNIILNRESLQGEHDALLASGVKNIGVTSTTAQWQTITGSWKNNWPSWGFTIFKSSKQARQYCTGHQFTGGPSWLMMYKSNQSQVDQDIAC
jgi:hypothetical protein